jgi:sterol O-acyltransferase
MEPTEPEVGSPPQASKPDLASLTNGKSAMSYALNGLTSRPAASSEGSWTPEDMSAVSEDGNEDLLKPQNGSGAAGLRSRSTTAIASDDSSVELPDNDKRVKRHDNRRKSIQVIIQESGKKGRYFLKADDPEFLEIVNAGIEREAAKLSGKSRSRLRDLVFTRQFTTFDRQNPRGAQSPFHGFFTLFWLSMALLLFKIAAQNWKDQGSVFGRAEIIHLMVDRDLVLMLATDGMMCLATSFGLLLHKAIAAGYLTWGRSGWIIQSVWEVWFTCNFIWVCFYREWSWTHTVFIVLHNIVLLMKQHSYGFTNGYCASDLLQLSPIFQMCIAKLTFHSIASLQTQTTSRGEAGAARRHGRPRNHLTDLTRNPSPLRHRPRRPKV